VFVRAYGGAVPLLVGANGIPLDEFLLRPAADFVVAGS